MDRCRPHRSCFWRRPQSSSADSPFPGRSRQLASTAFGVSDAPTMWRVAALPEVGPLYSTALLAPILARPVVARLPQPARKEAGKTQRTKKLLENSEHSASRKTSLRFSSLACVWSLCFTGTCARDVIGGIALDRA